MKASTSSLLLILAVALLAIQVAHGMTMQIEPRTTECFKYKSQRPGEDFTFEFVVTRGGLLDIQFRIVNPFGAVLHSELHFFPEGEEFVKTIRSEAGGEYSLCFDNEMSRWTAKVVKFEITTESSPSQQASSSETLKPLERSARNIKRELERVLKEQKYLRVREQTHRDTQENTYTRVYLFSTLESCVLIGMTVFQIFYMKKWFNTRKTGGV